MRHRGLLWAIVLSCFFGSPLARGADVGVVPTNSTGRALNLGFEDGTLRDWKPAGTAFALGPVEGDVVHARRGDMQSGHNGRFWVGSYEKHGDEPRGTLTSVPFRLSKPFLSFLIGAGAFTTTRAEVVRADNGMVIAKASGDDVEDMRRVSFDLTANLNQEVFIRLVDDDGRGWGHVNFDDVRLHDTTVFGTQKPTADAFLHAGLSPEDAAKAMTVPPGFGVSLFAGEPDVHQPIACAFDDRGRLWVAEAYSYPVRVPTDQARDQILIFEDTNGDGHFDNRKVFADKLNLVSGIEFGHGGVYVGAAPDFLFIPDRNHDDAPDGPAEVLLDGWGYQDTHEMLNSFTWGPDGWLYGCHGVFTHSKVGKPGTPEQDRVPINAGIWRYHPTRHTFEVFAHGTSNPWGLTWNAQGQAFETACVIPHLFQMIPGGRYERQAGQHFNPYTYDDIKTIADHRHYVGANVWAANGKSGDVGGGHAHCGALIYQGGAWPSEYADSILMNNIHGARFNRDLLSPVGSGFVGKHGPDFLMANDAWSQVISLKVGPDGQMSFIDWYDRQQCHVPNAKVHDRTNGRIFKLSYGKPGPVRVDLNQESTARLMTRISDPNIWYVEHALRILAERAATDPEATRLASDLGDCADRADTFRLRYLWARHAAGVPTDLSSFDDPAPAVRGWAVRLASEGTTPPAAATLARFRALAESDPSPVVRLELASACQRLPLAERWPILTALMAHAEDTTDPNLPLMNWYAFEPLAALDPGRALQVAVGAKQPNILPFTVRRVAALGTPEAMGVLVDVLQAADGSGRRRVILEAVNLAFQGRTSAPMPPAWPVVALKLSTDADPEVRSLAESLGLTFGDKSAYAVLHTTIAAPGVAPSVKLRAIETLRKFHDVRLSTLLRPLITDPDLGATAIRYLAAFDDPGTPPALLAAYPSLSPASKRDTLNTLAARSPFARTLLDAVEAGRITRTELTADLIRQLRNLKDAELDARIAHVWGIARDSTGDKVRRIADAKKKWTQPATQAADPMLGRAVFTKNCAQCHNLFGTGGNIGPELTGSNRTDLDYLLSNVYDPSALIGKDYQATVVATRDGRVLTGIIRAEDKDALTLATTTETLTLPKNQVEDRKTSDTSMMPEGIWDNLPDHEIRSLIAYLASPTQVALLATPDTVAALFNGRDLTGWTGDPHLWRVEGGEIVGQIRDKITRHAFLRSDLSAGDFRLGFDVKLVANQGNSGMQFRSEPIADGQIKGYQSDIGPDWWGKLYEVNGRGGIVSTAADKLVKPGDWNRVEITAQGSRIITTLNGSVTADVDDPSGARRGIFALQLHLGGPTEVHFRNFQLELLSPLAITSPAR